MVPVAKEVGAVLMIDNAAVTGMSGVPNDVVRNAGVGRCAAMTRCAGMGFVAPVANAAVMAGAAGRVAFDPMLGPLPLMLGCRQGRPHGQTLNRCLGSSKAADCPVADQCGHE